ncbi:MAG: hypothetical protein C5B51_15095 [Terriglobia bacterium]|nr:MAG: hypothetical protein C5B51_15095 [Terriglobia bacterium]
MKRCISATPILLALSWFAVGLLPRLGAQSGKALYVVTHVDIAGTSSRLEEATRAVREFGAASQKDPGVVRFEIVQQEGHPNHFTIYEVWKSREAFETHLAAPYTLEFRQKIQPVLGSPFREKLHTLVP